MSVPTRDAPPFDRYPLLRFACPKCGAEVGEHCIAASGRTTYDSHTARYAAEADHFRAKVPCVKCGTVTARAYLDPDGVCASCT